MQPLLSPELQTHVRDARQLLSEIRDAMGRFDATDADRETLATSIHQLDEFFLLVIVGEFNAGKSAFINALIGQTVSPEGVTPTTARLHVLEYGAETSSRVDDEGVVHVTAPAALLRDLHIVDTPGTNAIIREHEALTKAFVPRSDLVLFVTSADRPFTETERAFLNILREWGKKIVIILNKVDIFQTEAELEQVVTFVRDAGRAVLGSTPVVFPVSSRLAYQAKTGDPSRWQPSRFEALEEYIRETLVEGNRFRLKLANPLGVALALVQRYGTIAEERLTLLQDDLVLLRDIDAQLAIYEDDLARGFQLRMTAIDAILLEMESRGHAFFDDTLRLGRMVDLLNRPRIQKEFESRVIGDAPRQIEREVSALIDWLVDQDYRQWHAVTSRLTDRTRQHGTRVMGGPGVGTFHTDRARVIHGVGTEAQRVVETYDREREAVAMGERARDAVTHVAAAGGAALSLGTVVTLAASSAAVDITGLVAASVLAAVGFLIIPRRRRQAKNELKSKMTDLRERLSRTLRAEFERVQQQSVARIQQAVDPYSRFVRAEEQRSNEARTTLGRLRERTTRLRERLAV